MLFLVEESSSENKNSYHPKFAERDQNHHCLVSASAYHFHVLFLQVSVVDWQSDSKTGLHIPEVSEKQSK